MDADDRLMELKRQVAIEHLDDERHAPRLRGSTAQELHEDGERLWLQLHQHALAGRPTATAALFAWRIARRERQARDARRIFRR